MKKISSIALLPVLFILITSADAFGQRGSSKRNRDAMKTEITNYASYWKTIDSLDNKRLTTSARQAAEEVYTKAAAENNTVQTAKAIIYRIKLESQIEESALQKAITNLNVEIKKSKFPLTPVLHSILAELYWSYYENNRWRILDRTATTARINTDDISTWDLKTIVGYAISHYQMSLINPDSTKKVSASLFKDILTAESSGYTDSIVPASNLRSTLYDFLAHRAVDFYMNEEPSVINLLSKFEFNQPELFGSYKDFAKLNLIDNSNKSSAANSLPDLKFIAINILQDLINFHSNDVKPDALIDVDLERLNFVYKNSTLEQKDKLYLESLANLKQQFILSPSSSEIDYNLAQLYADWGNLYQPFEGETHKWDKKTAVDICTETIRKFPDSYGGKNCKHLLSLLQEKSLGIDLEQENLPEKPFRGNVNYRNVKTIYLKIVKDDSSRLRKSNSTIYGRDLVDNLLKKPVVQDWFLNLPNDGDYQAHSTEFKLQELPLGHYALIVSTDKGFASSTEIITFQRFSITNIAYVQRRSEDGGYDYIVVNRETGAPLKGVQTNLWALNYSTYSKTNEYNKEETFTSNENGICHISNSTKRTKSYLIELAYGADHLIIANNIYFYNYQPAEVKPQLKSFFFTDRTIYRPGQTILFKAVLLESDGHTHKIKPKERVVVTLYDVNFNIVTNQSLVTNEFGSYNGMFVIPQNTLTGEMHLSDNNGTAYFSVEEYKRPNFEVTFNPIADAYKLAEDVSVKGKAASYAGAKVSGAKVKYRVVRTADFPRFNYYSAKGIIPRYIPFPNSTQVEITNGEIQTNDTGGFVINFNAIPDSKIKKEYKPYYTYQVAIDVTDISGETHGNTQNITVGYDAMTLDIGMRDYINRDSTPNYNITTANLNNEFLPATVKINIWKQKTPDRLFRKRLWQQPDKHLLSQEEYYEAFPYDLYTDEDNVSKWEKQKSVFTGEIKTEKGKNLLSIPTLPSWENGAYVLEATTTDKFGQEIKESKYFTLYSAKDKNIPANTFDWYSVITNRGEPGTKAAFMLGTKAKDVKIYFEIESKDKIVKSEWLTLNSELKKIEIPIEEKDRGNFGYHLVFVNQGRVYEHSGTVVVPYTNKELDIKFETFRSKIIPGAKEEWRVKITNKKGDKVAAEMVAGMYDASLDYFRDNKWSFDLYRKYFPNRTWETYYVSELAYCSVIPSNKTVSVPSYSKSYDALNWFGYNPDEIRYRGGRSTKRNPEAVYMEAGPIQHKAMESSNSNSPMGDTETLPEKQKQQSSTSLENISARKNLAETAFFYPTLKTDANGSLIISFKLPEALTRWKVLAFAHTKDLQYGLSEKELVTQKELMITPNAPRFLRAGDTLVFKAKVDNLSDKDMNGTAQLFLYDALSMKEITAQLIKKVSTQNSFTVKKGSNSAVDWTLIIPEGLSAVTYKVVAKAGNLSDGEESTLPILTNRMLVTESIPLYIKGKQTKAYTFNKLISENNHSATLRNHKLTLEFSANPVWYAVQSLPYMMEYPYECSEQVFASFYANSLASHVANSSPKIKAVFDAWKASSPDAFLSNLEKNQELKSLILEETPWVLQAKNEKEQKKQIAMLFDLNKMNSELESSLNKLFKMQSPNGSWPWFKGMGDDRYLTQYIIAGMGHLDNLGIKSVRNNSGVWNTLTNAINYCDAQLRSDYEQILKDKILEKDNLSNLQIQYLYARSFFKDVRVDPTNQKAYDYFRGQAHKYWNNKSRYMGGMIALTLYRLGDNTTPLDIMKSLKENALHSDELGMYWKENYEGYYWYESPIESQALMIEAFDEITKDKEAVDELQLWLLNAKRTEHWPTTKSTAEAVYALLLKGIDNFTTDNVVEFKLGNTVIDPNKLPDAKAEAGTGYFKTSWTGTAIKPDMGNISITKNSDGLAWGAIYWQYFEQLDKITPSKTPLEIKKRLFKEVNTPSGLVLKPLAGERLQTGDKIKVRIEIRSDRNLEYVHLKDMRASGFEPTNVLSSYKYQDGLGYYESTRDASTNFFISYLPKGTYVFEYPLVISSNGNFSNGITSIQCLYAPEFTSNSEGVRVSVGK